MIEARPSTRSRSAAQHPDVNRNKKILTVVGARPQFVKAAVVSRAFARAGVEEWILHTGQHYDPRMSDVFFDELGIPAPTRNLRIGSGSHGSQTGRMLAAIEQAILEERPDRVLVYGDTNSTLAAALAASRGDAAARAGRRVGAAARAARRHPTIRDEACQPDVRSIHWSPYDRVRVVNADP